MTTAPRRILFLDIDGPLTTQVSRQTNPEVFGIRAADAMKFLLSEGKPDLCVVHSSWRKLPEPSDSETAMGSFGGYYWSHDLWRDICRAQNLGEFDALALEDAPFKMSSNRGHEISWWLDRNPSDVTAAKVILDDEMSLIEGHDYAQRDDTLLVRCDDAVGITMEQAHQAVAFWRRVAPR